MIYDELPIFKAILDFTVYIETVVKGFDKYHKYTIGADLRNYSKEMLFLVHRANKQQLSMHIVNMQTVIN